MEIIEYENQDEWGHWGCSSLRMKVTEDGGQWRYRSLYLTVESFVGVLPHFQTSLYLETLWIEEITNLLIVYLQHAESYLEE